MIVLLIFCFILTFIGSISFALYMKYKRFYINICKAAYIIDLSYEEKIDQIRNFIRDMD